MNSFLEKLKNNKTLVSLPLPKKKFIWSIIQFPLFNSALNEIGWFKSVWKEQGVDAKGNPIPWITYPTIEFLNERLDKKMKVFEYGSGNSTMWWAERVKSVISVEYDMKWYEKVKNTLPKNAELIYVPLGIEYAQAILNSKQKFDVVMVDGRMRIECAKNSVSKLSAGGVIVWDNTDRDKYKPGIMHLKKAGFKTIDFVGMVPSSNKISKTTIFYR